jgi:hypothetical protein
MASVADSSMAPIRLEMRGWVIRFRFRLGFHR